MKSSQKKNENRYVLSAMPYKTISEMKAMRVSRVREYMTSSNSYGIKSTLRSSKNNA